MSRILLVDQDPELPEALAALLRAQGHEVPVLHLVEILDKAYR